MRRSFYSKGLTMAGRDVGLLVPKESSVVGEPSQGTERRVNTTSRIRRVMSQHKHTFILNYFMNLCK